MISRRNMLASLCLSAIGLSLPASDKSKNVLPIGLNAGSILRYKLPLVEQIKLVSKHGYNSIEIWSKDIDAHIESGGNLKDIKNLLSENNLSLCNIIAFANCMVDDLKKRQNAIDIMKRDMKNAKEIGAKHIALTMLGVDKFDRAKIPEYANRYKTVLDLGRQMQIQPLLEIWGHRALSKLSDAVAICLESKDKDAALLLDFYHLYRGGNSFDELNLLNLKSMPVFHINDYPKDIELSKLKDKDRVFPGDGICPFKKLLKNIYNNGFRGVLSLEVFNNDKWINYSVDKFLSEGYQKTKRVIEESLS